MSASKVIEVDREKVISILNITLSKENGSEIYIPCSSKKEQRDMHTCVVRELKVLSEIDPADAAAITHRAIFKDCRFWVVLTKVEPSLNSIYIKGRDGSLSKQTI